MEATFKSNLEDAANTIQSIADSIVAYDPLEHNPEDLTSNLSTVAARLRQLSENPGYVVLAGNPIDGMRIIGPWLDANDAGDEARETIDDHWTVVEIDTP